MTSITEIRPMTSTGGVLFLLLSVVGATTLNEPPVYPEAFNAPCDCAIRWQNLGSPSALSVPINFSTVVTVLETLPFTNAEQAQFLCHSRLDCRGVAFYDPQNADPTGYLFGYSDGTRASAVFPSGNLTNSFPAADDVFLGSTTFYLLNRFELYRCADFALDPYYFYFADSNQRKIVESFSCPYPLPAGGAITCCWHIPSGGNCTNYAPARGDPLLSTDTRWQTVAQQVWESQGASLRLKPSAACDLLPSLWTYGSQCASETPGCFRVDPTGVPCDTHGLCLANVGSDADALYSTPYYCQCANYTGFRETGEPNFDHVQQYMGRACNYATTDYCTDPDHPETLCSGFNTRCIPQIVANTAPSTDYHPRCDCEASPPVIGAGRFCETNRCDPTNLCKVLGDSVGECQVTSLTPTPQYGCVCSYRAIGTFCEIDTSGCLFHPGDPAVCDGNGVCRSKDATPALYHTDPNYSNTSVWCDCTDGLSHGPKCEQKFCDPAYITSGRAICETSTGAFIRCLEPFDSSDAPGAKKCDVDRCAVSGGALAGNPPSACTCGSFHTGTEIGLADITCYPRCANYSGVECGPADPNTVQENLCIQSAVDGLHYAQCQCDFGYILALAPNTSETNFSSVRAPPGQNPMVCVKFCMHGGITNPSFSENNQAPCDCSHTGYSGDRCDVALCRNGGQWDTALGRCVCIGPFTGPHCQAHTCGNSLAPLFQAGVPGMDPDFPSDVICLCNPPFTSTNLTSRIDCLGSLCGPLGVIPSTLQTGDPVNSYCQCITPTVTTQCFDSTGASCAFCHTPSCVNGGVVSFNGTHAPACTCPFPYGGTYCQSHLCGAHGAPSDAHCACSEGWSGARCDDLLFVPPPIPSNSSSTGVHNESSSSSSTAHHSSSTAVHVSGASSRTHPSPGTAIVLFTLALAPGVSAMSAYEWIWTDL